MTNAQLRPAPRVSPVGAIPRETEPSRLTFDARQPRGQTLGAEEARCAQVVASYRLHVKLHKVIDLSTAERLLRAAHSIADVTSEDVTAPRYLGGAVAFLGCPGLLISSARAGGMNL